MTAADLIARLAEQRRALGLTQTVLAKRMGTCQTAISEMERGHSSPTLNTVSRYAEAVGLELHLTEPTA